MFKKLIILPLALTALTAGAATPPDQDPKPPQPNKPAKNFQEVARAVNHGAGLHAVINFDKCETNAQLPAEVIASVHPKAVLLVKGKKVTFSNVHFTTYHPEHLGEAVYQYTKYVLNADDTFTVHAEALNPTTFERVGHEVELNCKLNSGVRIFTRK